MVEGFGPLDGVLKGPDLEVFSSRHGHGDVFATPTTSELLPYTYILTFYPPQHGQPWHSPYAGELPPKTYQQ